MARPLGGGGIAPELGEARLGPARGGARRAAEAGEIDVRDASPQARAAAVARGTGSAPRHRLPQPEADERVAPGALFVGTSGWDYAGGAWDALYPAALPRQERLVAYARSFASVELNYSFYRLPRPSTYTAWAARTPESFRFALKLSRFVTHVKRLRGTKQAFRHFVANALALGPKLGPILVQLPPSFQADPERLARFLEAASDVARTLSVPALRLAIEPRHASWLASREVLALLRRHDAALVAAQSRRYPCADPALRTASFAYLRFHGPGRLFASRYGREALRPFARRIRAWLREGSDVFAYFNNDVEGHAVDDARTLASLAAGAPHGRPASGRRAAGAG